MEGCLPDVDLTKSLIYSSLEIQQNFLRLMAWNTRFLLTFIDNTFSFQTFPFSNTRFLDLEGFTDIRTYHRAVDASSERVSVCCREEDIRKR